MTHTRAHPLFVVCATLAALAAIGYGLVSNMWFVEETNVGNFRVGLLSAEACTATSGCLQVAASAFDSEEATSIFSLLVVAIALLNGLLLALASVMHLLHKSPARWLANAVMVVSLFGGALAGGWMALSPWAYNMSPSLGAVSFFVGMAMAIATALVPLEASRRR